MLRKIWAIICCIIYTFLYHLGLFLFLNQIFHIKESISCIIVISLFLIHLVIFIVFNRLILNIEQSDISNIDAPDERLNNAFNTVLDKVKKKYPNLTNIKYFAFSSKDKMISNFSFGSPGIASVKRVLLKQDGTKTYYDYELQGIICHELGHINSKNSYFIFITSIINFFPIILGKIMFLLYSLFLSLSFHVKNKVSKYLLKFISVIFYLFTFIINIPYNLLFSYIHITEERYADNFAMEFGYAYSLKYFFKKHFITVKEELPMFMLYPQHPFLENRIHYLNSYQNLSSEFEDFHFKDDMLFSYTGNSSLINIPFFIKILGDGNKPVLETTTVKEIISNQEIVNHFAFNNCSSITKISFNKNLKEIRNMSFSNCYNLTSFSHNSKSLKLGDKSFKGCTKMNSFDYENVTSIGNYCFANCILTDIKYPLKLKYINANSFYNAKINFTYDQFSNGYFGEYLIDLSKSKGLLILNCKVAHNLFISEDINNLKYVIIPNNNHFIYPIKKQVLIITDSKFVITFLPNSFITNNINDVKDYLILNYKNIEDLNDYILFLKEYTDINNLLIDNIKRES